MKALKKALPLLVVIALTVAYCVNHAKKNSAYLKCRQSGHTAEQCLQAEESGARPAQSETHPKAAAPAHDGIQATEAIEYVKGSTPDAINEEVISSMEALLIQDAQKKWAIRARESGLNSNAAQFAASSIKFDDNGQRGVVTQLHMTTKLPEVVPSLKVIWWIQSSELKRVFCLDPSGSDINIRRGTCGRQIAKTFSYSSWHRN